MKAKLFPIVTLIFLAVLLALAVPHKAEASCSGVNCGCDVDHATCSEGCEVWACYSACMKAYKECAIACCDDPGCPVVIPMGSDRQARFTDLAGGVLFDIDADGNQDRISWTDPSSTTVFLALDRNGDGAVTDGSELFGNHTAQSPSAEPNGFIALAEFDTISAGGNGDGVISELDSVFANLWLWHDANHDGQSQPEELRSLSQSGLIEIELRYHESQRRDQFGNLLRYQAKVGLAGGKTKAIDVFFLQE